MPDGRERPVTDRGELEIEIGLLPFRKSHEACGRRRLRLADVVKNAASESSFCAAGDLRLMPNVADAGLGPRDADCCVVATYVA